MVTMARRIYRWSTDNCTTLHCFLSQQCPIQDFGTPDPNQERENFLFFFRFDVICDLIRRTGVRGLLIGSFSSI